MLDQNTINQALLDFKISADCVNLHQHRHFIFADVMVEPGNLTRLRRSLPELSVRLKSKSLNLKLKPSDGVVQLQMTISDPQKFLLSDLIKTHQNPNTFLLGETIEGEAFELNLKQDPHVLIAGTTGSGKSNLLHNLIANARRLHQVELHLMDPKKIEFERYRGGAKIHSLTSSYEEACQILTYLGQVMEERYSLLNHNRNISFPTKIVIIDELADLILQDKKKQFELALVRLAAKARACGIHLIVATQRPSVNVVTGLIKANFPARLACRVVSRVDSQIILDELGAENLLGKGDALFKSGSIDLTRLQIALAD